MVKLKKFQTQFFVSMLVVSNVFANTVKIGERHYDVEKTTKITLRNKALKTIPRAIGKLKNLEKLDLSSNNITDLANLKDLPKLREVNLSRNNIDAIPDSFATLTALTRLNLAHNKIRTVPATVTELANLVAVDMSYNDVEFIPEAWSKDMVDWSNNPKPLIIDGKVYSRFTKVLDLSRKKLTAIPVEVSLMVELEELDLSNNCLASLDGIASLTTLRSLNIAKNELNNFPRELLSLPNLQTLNANRNNLTDLPDSIHTMRSLTKLSLSGNNFTAIPETALSLRSLTYIDWSQNQIETLPENLNALRRLNTLLLRSNNLNTLPDSIGYMEELVHLDVSHNQLEGVPLAMSNAPKLATLQLEGNAITKPPASLAKIHRLTLSFSTPEEQFESYKPWLEIFLNTSTLITLTPCADTYAEHYEPLLIDGFINQDHEFAAQMNKFNTALTYKGQETGAKKSRHKKR